MSNPTLDLTFLNHRLQIRSQHQSTYLGQFVLKSQVLIYSLASSRLHGDAWFRSEGTTLPGQMTSLHVKLAQSDSTHVNETSETDFRDLPFEATLAR